MEQSEISLEDKEPTKQPIVLDNKKLALALSGIVLSILLASLDQTIVNPAMPRIVEELQGFSLFAWVTTAYLLTSTATIPIAGKFGDMFGRKLVLITAIIIFLLSSALSGAAPGMIWLVIFRGIQGIGAGALQGNAFAQIAELFPDTAKRARWQGFISACFGVSSLLGPSLGGFITDNLNWRWVFYVNIPVGTLAIISLLLNLPNFNPSGRRRIDWWGAAAITGAVVCLLLALTWGGQKPPSGYEWDSPQILGLFAGSIILAGAFIWIETRVQEPIVPLKLFAIPTLRVVVVMSLGVGGMLLGTILFIPMFVQVVLGQSASSSGAITTPLALAQITASIITTQFIGRIGNLKAPLVAGGILVLAGVGLLFTLGLESPTWQVTACLIVVGLGLGPLMPGTTILVQETVPRKNLGVGISSMQFFRAIGSTVGVAMIGTFVTGTYVSNINAQPSVQNLNAQLRETIQQPQNLLNKGVAGNLPPDVVRAVNSSLVDAMHHGFMITACFATLVFVLTVFFIPNIWIMTARNRRARATARPLEAQGEASLEGVLAESLAANSGEGEKHFSNTQS
jgi:EmrB/QacA subfamily drug resistance transporter